jgi:hypothetical protein
MDDMSRGEVGLEPEVRGWYQELDEDEQARVEFHVDRLAELGPLLDEPHTKQLDGKLRQSGDPDHVLDCFRPTDHPAYGLHEDSPAGPTGSRASTPSAPALPGRSTQSEG